MTARILVVDDIEANVRLLEAKLSAEYYDVVSATDGVTALAVEQERLEGWIMDEVHRGVPLPGLYPANAETQARYEAWKKKG